MPVVAQDATMARAQI